MKETIHPGFFVIERFPNYAISRAGEIINLKDNIKKIGISQGKRSSVEFKIADGNKIVDRWTIMAETFLVPPATDSYVGFKNGIKFTGDVDNLYWKAKGEASHLFTRSYFPS